ncbi:hypothetical protein OOK13_28980 [Streptomyces sp. NBC_00378]|nr:MULTISPECIES: hypothetical protein [unclassified Streptomyces]MCX5112444.1 hypothetical protein [Streptomyces sp. NBC_00378]
MSRSNVLRQNRASNSLTALPTRRRTCPGVGGSTWSLRHRATTAAANRSRDSSTGHSSVASHPASRSWSSSVFARNPCTARISPRCRWIALLCQSWSAHASAGTFTCWATYSTAAAGTSLADSGNRAFTSKNFSSSANPSRVAPDLFRTSSSSSVQTSIRSSGASPAALVALRP